MGLLKSKKFTYFSWLAVIAWMAVIFYLSGQVATESNNLSTGITEIIMNIVKRLVASFNIDIENFNHIIRKNAHFFAYLVLGMLVVNAMIQSRFQQVKSFAFSILICVLYAASDEFHQLFVLGRSGELKDVLIDSSGAILGIILFFICRRILRSKTSLQ